MTKKMQQKRNALALLSLFIFIVTFLEAGIWLNDFYAFPSPIVVLLGIIAAFLLFKQTIEDKVNTLISGCGESKIITMCLIYLLAGAFAVVTKAMGGVDSVVNLGITILMLLISHWAFSSLLPFFQLLLELHLALLWHWDQLW